MCAGGALCGFSRFGLVVCAFCLSIVCLGCVEPLPFPMVSETCLLQVIFYWPLFGFRSLVGVSFYSFLSVFFSLLLLYVGVVNALVKWRLRTMCGSRTGGWSLPGVMSD
jgi:hypothetical protein